MERSEPNHAQLAALAHVQWTQREAEMMVEATEAEARVHAAKQGRVYGAPCTVTEALRAFVMGLVLLPRLFPRVFAQTEGAPTLMTHAALAHELHTHSEHYFGAQGVGLFATPTLIGYAAETICVEGLKYDEATQLWDLSAIRRFPFPASVVWYE
jgi:hypothetical protein